MLIKPNKNVIHGSRWFKAGKAYQVEDGVGAQLIEDGFATEVTQEAVQQVEKAQAKRKSRAASRKAVEVEDVEEAFTPIPEAE